MEADLSLVGRAHRKLQATEIYRWFVDAFVEDNPHQPGERIRPVARTANRSRK